MTSTTEILKEAEAQQYAEDVGRTDLAARLEERIDDHREAARTVAELRDLISRSETAGLGDDPAVEALRDHADHLREKHGIERDPTATERLVDEFDLEETAVERLHEDDRARLRENLEAVEKLEQKANARSRLAFRNELDTREDRIASLLDHNEVAPAELLGGDDVDVDGDHAAALLADLDDEEV